MKTYKLKEFAIFCIVSLVMIEFSFAQQLSTNTVTQEKEFVTPQYERFGKFIKELKNSTNKELLQLGLILENLEKGEIIPFLIQTRYDKNADVRICILEGLVILTGKDAIPYLKESFIKEKEEKQKYEIAEKLFGLGDNSVKNFLIKIYRKDLKGENIGNRISAAFLLADMDGIDKDLIIELVNLLNYGSDLTTDGFCGTPLALASMTRKESAKRLLDLLRRDKKKTVLKILKNTMKQEESKIKEILQDIAEKGGCYETRN